MWRKIMTSKSTSKILWIFSDLLGLFTQDKDSHVIRIFVLSLQRTVEKNWDLSELHLHFGSGAPSLAKISYYCRLKLFWLQWLQPHEKLKARITKTMIFSSFWQIQTIGWYVIISFKSLSWGWQLLSNNIQLMVIWVSERRDYHNNNICM